MQKPNANTMIFGTIIFLATMTAWLYGESHGIKTDIIWIVAVPVITALFIGGPIADARDAAQQAALQTNGTMESRFEKIVNRALATRDATRTWQQAQGTLNSPMMPLGDPNANQPDPK